MARMARIVIPHYPHHVTQRGNRRQQTFFSEGDYESYIELLVHRARRAQQGSQSVSLVQQLTAMERLQLLNGWSMVLKWLRV